MKQMLHPKLAKTLMSLVGVGLITVNSACGDLKKEAEKDTNSSQEPTPAPNPSVLKFELSASSIAENLAADSEVGTFSLLVANPAATITYSLVAGDGDADNSAFTISGSSLRMLASADFESKASYSIRVEAKDAAGLVYAQALTVAVTNVNEAPTAVALSASSVAENSGSNAVVGALSATDPDAGSTFTYSFVSGTGDTDNSSFNISGGQLTMAVGADYEVKSSYSVRVKAQDADGLSFENAFSISITDVNEAPTSLALSANSLAENGSANATVGTLSAVDPDAGASLTYSLVSGAGSADNSDFSIVGNQLKKNLAADYETKNSYSVRVQVSDGTNQAASAFTVNITDANDSPTLAAINNQSVLVGQSKTINLVIADQDAADQNLVCNSAVSVVGTLADPIDGLTPGGSWPNCNVAITTKTVEAHSAVTLRVTDSAGAYAERTFDFSAVDFALSNNQIAENSTNLEIGTLAAFSGSPTATFALVSGTGDTDNGDFTIAGNKLNIKASPNYEMKSSYSVRLRATLGAAVSDAVFTVTVTDVNEAPTITLNSPSAVINEGQTATVTLSIADPDAGTTLDCATALSYMSSDTSVVASTGAVVWTSTLTGCQGVISTASADAYGSSNLTISVSDSALSSSDTFALTVTNIDDAPTVTGSVSTAEDTPANGTVTITDIDSSVDCAQVNATSSLATLTVSGTSGSQPSPATCNVAVTPDADENGTDSAVAFTVNSVVATGSFGLTVTAVDDAPVASGSVTTLEDTAGNGTVTLTDVDSTVDCTQVTATSPLATITVTDVSGTSGPQTRPATCSVAVTPNTNANGTDNAVAFTVNSVAASTTFTLTVTAANDAPTNITLSSSSIAENGTANQVVGQLGAADVDATDTFTYTLVTGTGDADNSAFTISGNALQLNSPADYETKSSYSILVQVADSGNLLYTKAFTVSVTNRLESVQAIQDQVGVTWYSGTAWATLINPVAAVKFESDAPCTGTGAVTVSYTSDNTALVGATGKVVFSGTNANPTTGTPAKCTVAVTPTAGVIGVANITLNFTYGTDTISSTFRYVVEQTAKSVAANSTGTATSISFGNTGIATLAGDYISATGSCPAGSFTYTSGTVSGYDIPSGNGACSITFGTEVYVQPVAVSAADATKNRTNYSVIAPKTENGSVNAKFLGRSYLAPGNGGVAAPAYTFAQVADTDAGTCSTGTMASGVYQVSTTANCSIRFDVNNPCGDSGLADNSLIHYSTADATDTARIDRIMSKVTDTANWKGDNTSTGTGTANCANSGCHGATSRSSYSSKWAMGYTGANDDTATTVSTSFTVASANWASNDNTGGYNNKLLFTRAGGTSTATNPIDRSYNARDPLNSRFYRKLNSTHFRASRAGWGSSQMPGYNCGTSGQPACLTANQQEMMCHWIWNGAPY